MDDWLLRFKKKQKYLVLDEETESLSLTNARPWQSTATICEGDNIIKEIDDYILWDDLDISEGAKVITRWNEWDYKKRAISPQKAWKNLEKYLYDPEYLIIGSNLLNFDVYILN